MERIENLVGPDAPKERYPSLVINGELYEEAWLPALPWPMFGLRHRLADAWAVLRCRATAVQWPHQR